MPSHERRRRREKAETDSIDSDNATSDNFSQPADEQCNFSDLSSGQSADVERTFSFEIHIVRQIRYLHECLF